MRRRFFTFLVIFLLAAPTLVIAQAPLRDNAYVRIYDHDDPANPTAYTMVFTSTAERSLSKTPVETTSTITFSPDGTWRGETFYSAEDGTPTLSYGKVGDPVQNTIE
ncbi:MAG TPA: hypothetical protein PLD47_01350, partial [Aggregatilineales bacterium]|nr:hypothetical protein [Aggregatilineales bacterium]